MEIGSLRRRGFSGVEDRVAEDRHVDDHPADADGVPRRKVIERGRRRNREAGRMGAILYARMSFSLAKTLLNHCY